MAAVIYEDVESPALAGSNPEHLWRAACLTVGMSLRPSSDTPWGILVVEDDLGTLRPLLELLRNTGYSAAGALNFDAASGLVRAIPFDLMIAGVKPGADTSLDLIRLAREQQPGMAVIAMTATPDPVVERECTRLGATCLLRPVELPPFLSIVAEKVSDLSRRRRWARKNILGGFDASVAGRKAKVVDMSYGGFRLEMPVPLDTAPPAPVEVTLLSFGLSVNATLVWSRNFNTPGPWLSGAALRDTDESTARAWRVVVDALPDWARTNQPSAG
jgi:CheY-like chemotaxis protein